MHDSAAGLLDSVLDRQREAWLAGQRPSIEDLLSETDFQDDHDVQLDLLYNEIVIREELGQDASLDECVARYPHLEEELRLHFEIHHAIQQRLLLNTAGVATIESWPETLDRRAQQAFPDDDFEIMQVLGQGGMATVYQARHRKLHRCVALKLFQSGRNLNARELFRVRTEAKAMARLSHPNIVKIFEIGDCNGSPFLALELAENGTLARKLQQFQYTPRAAAELIEVLANAIHHAHERNVIHRDLKPANVLFTADDKPMITDFGLAKVLHDRLVTQEDATRTGEAIGTPRYMSPEQAAGNLDMISPATDVYALGSLLYECLTGRAPFMATSVVQTLHQICHDDPLPPSRLQACVPKDLETICLHCLEKRPNHRYSSALELAEELHRFLNDEPIQARPTPLWEVLLKWCRRKPTHAALVFGAVGICSFGIMAMLVTSRLRAEHIDELRRDVSSLMQQGRMALDTDDSETAQARFESAWMTVQSEPELSDHETSVAGWLDHSRNAVNRYQWKQRTPPPAFDQRRDEALLESLLMLRPAEAGVEPARSAIQSALGFTVGSDMRWQTEREQLAIQDAAVVEQASGAEAALATLDSAGPFASRLFHSKRAELLDRLSRYDEASAARRAADGFPENNLNASLQSGMDHVRHRDFEHAQRDFDDVLQRNPEHFAARLFQAICFLRLQRAGEARVALTACIAQRPTFQWNYYFRGQANRVLGDIVRAEEDFRMATEGRDQSFVRDTAMVELESLQNASGTSTERGSE